MSLDESGSNSAKVAATSLLLRVTRGSSDAYFLRGFPVFEGEVENWQYKELGSDMKTVTFFDYKCEESVAKTYYAKFIPEGFTKSDGSEIYRKTVDKTIYTFSGSYSGGNFALSFSVETK